MDRHNTLNRLLLVNPFDDIPRPQIQQDRIPSIRHLVAQPIDRAERLLQAIPLRGVAVAASRDGQWIGEGSVVAPEREFLEGGTARKEVEDGGDESLLVAGEGDARGGLDVSGF